MRRVPPPDAGPAGQWGGRLPVPASAGVRPGQEDRLPRERLPARGLPRGPAGPRAGHPVRPAPARGHHRHPDGRRHRRGRRTGGAASPNRDRRVRRQARPVRKARDAGADPLVVSGWIAQVQADRARATADFDHHSNATPQPTRWRTREQISELVAGIADAISVPTEADPADKAEAYRQLGVRLTYHPDTQTVGVQAHVERLPWVTVRVRGPIPARATRGSRPAC